jgi:hypothetical protein
VTAVRLPAILVTSATLTDTKSHCIKFNIVWLQDNRFSETVEAVYNNFKFSFVKYHLERHVK